MRLAAVDDGAALGLVRARAGLAVLALVDRRVDRGDRLIGVGPLGIGLDGVLAWVPGAGLAYGMGAGTLLLFHAFHAGASPATLARMTVYLAADNLSDTVPVLGWAVDTLFPGHLMAAKALQKDIEARHGLPEEVALERSQKKRGLFRRKT